MIGISTPNDPIPIVLENKYIFVIRIYLDSWFKWSDFLFPISTLSLDINFSNPK